MSGVVEKVRAIIDSFDKDVVAITENDDLQQYGFNSIDFVNLVVKIETTFGIFVKDEDLLFENFDTIKKIEGYVLNAMQRRRSCESTCGK